MKGLSGFGGSWPDALSGAAIAGAIARGRSGHASRLHAVAEDSSPSARSAVAASWMRSITRYGLDSTDTRPPLTLTDLELREARERVEPLLRNAQASLDHLFHAVGGTGCCVLFADRHGVPVDRRGAAVDNDTFQHWDCGRARCGASSTRAPTALAPALQRSVR